MKNRLVAACLATLTFTACEDAQVSPPAPAPVIAQKKIVMPRPAPLALERRLDAGSSVAIDLPSDAGLDLLAMAHDTPLADHLGRAQQLQREGDRPGALTEARRALFTQPHDTDALRLAATLAQKTGRPELAAEAWGRLAALTPDDAAPLVQQARALHAARDYPGAVMAGREAVARDEGRADAHHVIGLAQLAMGELTGAIFSFRHTLELEPGNAWAMNNLGLAYLRANQDQEAVDVLEPAAELLPHVAFVHNNLGVALERVGRRDEARAAYLHAMDLSPRYVKARVNAERVARVQLEQDEVEPLVPEGAHPLPAP